MQSAGAFELTVSEKEDEDERAAVREALHRVYIRRLAGSSIYKSQDQSLRRTMSITGGEGERRIKAYVKSTLVKQQRNSDNSK